MPPKDNHHNKAVAILLQVAFYIKVRLRRSKDVCYVSKLLSMTMI